MGTLPVAIVSATDYPQPPAYSVWQVVREQAQIVARLGHEVRVAAPAEREVDDEWPDGARLRTVAGALPQLAERLAQELPDEVVILTHDLVTTAAGLDLIERVAEGHPDRRWAHWLHGQPGAPGPEWTTRYPLPRAWFVGQVDAQLEALRRVFRAPPSRVVAIPNHRSLPGYLGLGPIASSLVAACDWFGCRIRAVFPARRSVNKNWQGLLLLLTALADAGESVGLVGLDWAAGAADEPDSIDRVRARAEEAGVRTAFSSDLGFRRGVPSSTVRELLVAGNLFVLPSVEETSSLVTAEAMLCKNLVVLDEACAGARQVAGDVALYIDFARLVRDDAYRTDAARAVQEAILGDPVLAGQQRIIDELGLGPGGDRYARLLADMTAAPATGVDRVLCDPALAQPFRALLHPLLGETDGEARVEVEPTHEGVARPLDALARTCGVDGVADAFAQLSRYEEAFRGGEGTDRQHDHGRLSKGATLLPYTPLLDRYAARGRVADDADGLRHLLGGPPDPAAFLLLRRDAEGVVRAVVDGDSAAALERWLAGSPATDPAIDELREAGFLA